MVSALLFFSYFSGTLFTIRTKVLNFKKLLGMNRQMLEVSYESSPLVFSLIAGS